MIITFLLGMCGHGIPAAMMTVFMNQKINTEKYFKKGQTKFIHLKGVNKSL